MVKYFCSHIVLTQRYLSFEKFRRSLVQITDDVWELLQNDDKFYHWHPDGQMAVIEGYDYP